MADRSVVVRLRADIADFKLKMSEAAKSTEALSDKDKLKGLEDGLRRSEAGAAHLSTQLGLLGAGLVGAAAVAVKKFADFDQAMSNVAATGDDARGSIDQLREAALRAGAETSFSATEAANAIEELAKAGLSAKDIIGGGLNGALALAASDNLKLADAAAYTATAMNQFKLSGKDATHVADLLAAGAGKAMGGVDDMGQALNQAGLVASQTGLSIEETTGTLAAFAQQGLLGSDAGTSFKTMLQALSNPSGVAREKMDELGISMYDANGAFIGMEALAGQLQAKLGGLTVEQRQSALATIFGSDAVRAAAVVYDEGATGIAKWTNAVDDQGYAAETARVKMDNLKGDLEEFGGALETLMIKAGEGADGPLRALVSVATDLVRGFSELPDPLQQTFLLVGGGTGILLLGVAGMMKLSAATRDGVTAMQDMGLVTEKTGGRIAKTTTTAAKWAAGVGIIVTGLIALDAATDQAAMGTEELNAKLNGLGKSKDVVGDLFRDLVPKDSDLKRGKDFGVFLDQMANPGTWNTIAAGAGDAGVSITRLFGDDTAKWGELKDRVSQLGDQLGALAQSDLPAASEAFTALYEEAGATEEVGQNLLASMPGLRDALIGMAEGAGVASDDSTLLNILLGETVLGADGAAVSTDNLTSSTLAAAEAAQTQTEQLQELADAQAEAAGLTLSLRAAQRQMEESVAAATASLEKNGATLDITTQKGRENQAALDDVAGSTWDLIQSMQANGATQTEIQGVMATSRDRFVGVATAMGMGADEANALADQMGLIPENINTTVSVNTAAAETALASFRAAAERQTITIQARVAADPNYSPARSQNSIMRNRGGLIPGYAGGGFLGGQPPADPREDNLLAFTNAGRPVALRSGEFVQSQPAVDYYGVGFMHRLNNRQLPKEVVAGYAAGGYHAPANYSPPAKYGGPSAAPAGPTFQVQVDASGIIDDDIARQIAARTERNLMNAFTTFGLGAVASGVGA